MKVVRHEAVRANVNQRLAALKSKHSLKIPRGRTSWKKLGHMNTGRGIAQIKHRHKASVVVVVQKNLSLFSTAIIQMIIFVWGDRYPPGHARHYTTAYTRFDLVEEVN